MKSNPMTVASIALTLAALVALPPAASRVSAQSPHKVDKAKAPAVMGAIVEEPVFTELPGPGKKCWIGEERYFTYKFDKKPKLGTAILKVQLFDKSGARVTGLGILGVTDMPSMRGAHDSGEVPFKPNKKGDYLLPVNVVMPGVWEVKLIFLEDREPIFRGRFEFKV